MRLEPLSTTPRPLRWALVVVLGAIFAATLTPAADSGPPSSVWCVACGERGGADFILNVILFLPLGVVLRLIGIRQRTAVLVGCLLSIAIELTQELIPGRDTALGDVIANTTGTLVGFIVVAAAIAAVDGPRWAAIATMGFALAADGMVAMTGYLVAPDYPATAYWGQWTAELHGQLDWYRGHIVDATLGTLRLPSHRLDDQPSVHAALASGTRLDIVALAGPAPRRTAPIFSIYDDHQHEILLIGARGPDLVVRYRTRGFAWGLDRPYFTVSGAFATLVPGDTMHLTWWRQTGHFCVAFDADRHCPLGFTPGAAWSLLMYPESFPGWLRAALGAVAVGLLFLPLGLVAPPTRWLLIGGLLTTMGLAFLPGFVGLSPTPPIEWMGAALGMGLGVSARRYCTARPQLLRRLET